MHQKFLDLQEGIIRESCGLELQYRRLFKRDKWADFDNHRCERIELDRKAEGRKKEPVKGDTLKISLDANLQNMQEQMAEKSHGRKTGGKSCNTAYESAEWRNICNG